VARAKMQWAFSLRFINQRSAQLSNKTISHDRRAIDRSIPNHQIAYRGIARCTSSYDLNAAERTTAVVCFRIEGSGDTWQ
jgi:hypothetical protein